jgi:hypothetical protein
LIEFIYQFISTQLGRMSRAPLGGRRGTSGVRGVRNRRRCDLIILVSLSFLLVSGCREPRPAFEVGSIFALSVYVREYPWTRAQIELDIVPYGINDLV